MEEYSEAAAVLDEAKGAIRLGAGAPGARLPLQIEANNPALQADPGAVLDWFGRYRPAIDRLTSEIGAVTLRGFAVNGPAAFERLMAGYPSPDFGYTAGSAPRHAVYGRVMESTRAVRTTRINLHQEMAYLPRYPYRLAFYCHKAPAVGGETIIGDIRRFVHEADPALIEAVRARGVAYVRHFRSPDWSTGSEKWDLNHRTWVEGFNTADKAEAEAKCREMGFAYAWRCGGLEITYRAPGFVRHPRSGEQVWFNQFVGQCFAAQVLARDAELLETTHYLRDNHPFVYSTTFGDGGALDPAMLEAARALEDRIAIAPPWQDHDILLVDNFVTAHGRNPFEGERDVQVALLC